MQFRSCLIDIKLVYLQNSQNHIRYCKFKDIINVKITQTREKTNEFGRESNIFMLWNHPWSEKEKRKKDHPWKSYILVPSVSSGNYKTYSDSVIP